MMTARGYIHSTFCYLHLTSFWLCTLSLYLQTCMYHMHVFFFTWEPLTTTTFFLLPGTGFYQTTLQYLPSLLRTAMLLRQNPRFNKKYCSICLHIYPIISGMHRSSSFSPDTDSSISTQGICPCQSNTSALFSHFHKVGGLTRDRW